jgi:hypothetical protein
MRLICQSPQAVMPNQALQPTPLRGAVELERYALFQIVTFDS